MNAPIDQADSYFRGEDQRIAFTIRNNAGGLVNVTGWALRWQLYDRRGGSVLITKTTSDDVSVTDGPGGAVLVTVDAADTAGMQSGALWYELWRTDSGSAQVLAYGAVRLQ